MIWASSIVLCANLLSSGNHKIADTAALQFCGAPDDSKRIGRNGELRYAQSGLLAEAWLEHS